MIEIQEQVQVARTAEVPLVLRYAQAYAAFGWQVVPIEPGGKKPLYGCGKDHATTDLPMLRRWFANAPKANIGIRLDTSRLMAVDIDPLNGGRLELAEELPPTLTATTGRGGLHLLYRVPEGSHVPGKLHGQIGVDLRHNGYIVVEPSATTGGYRWRGWSVLEVDLLPEIADAPSFLFARKLAVVAASAIQASGTIVPGGRDEHLSRVAFKFRKAGLAVEQIEGALLALNRKECSPPIGDDEVRAIARGKEHIPGPGAQIEDFWAHMPSHQYLFTPTRELWPAASVNGRCPGLEIDGKTISPASYLDSQRAIEQMVWYPGEPELIENRVMQVAGWVRHEGARVFNLYRAPVMQPGDPTKASPWLDHVRLVYPDDHEHIVRWLAHRVQFPGVKCNHALVLGGSQGIGKDSLLEPVKEAVGPWNWNEISPTQMLGRFNGWAKSVVLRISEARDLGDIDRFKFYEASKVFIAALPDVLRVDEKHLRETYVQNVGGVIFTTNHATDGLYLPADDRRHYVTWSPRSRDDFREGYWVELWGWMNAGGAGHVAAYLRGLDLCGFGAKSPPKKTSAFWQVVAAGEAPESSELRDVIEELKNPEAITLASIIAKAEDMKLFGLCDDLRDRKAQRTIPHKMDRVGYVAVRNPDAASDGHFRIQGKRTAVYARRKLPVSEQIRAARRLA